MNFQIVQDCSSIDPFKNFVGSKPWVKGSGNLTIMLLSHICAHIRRLCALSLSMDFPNNNPFSLFYEHWSSSCTKVKVRMFMRLVRDLSHGFVKSESARRTVIMVLTGILLAFLSIFPSQIIGFGTQRVHLAALMCQMQWVPMKGDTGGNLKYLSLTLVILLWIFPSVICIMIHPDPIQQQSVWLTS